MIETVLGTRGLTPVTPVTVMRAWVTRRGGTIETRVDADPSRILLTVTLGGATGQSTYTSRAGEQRRALFYAISSAWAQLTTEARETVPDLQEEAVAQEVDAMLTRLRDRATPPAAWDGLRIQWQYAGSSKPTSSQFRNYDRLRITTTPDDTPLFTGSVEELAWLLTEPAALQTQIDRLGQFIFDNVPGEPSQPEGVVDTAIRVIGELQRDVVRHQQDHASASQLAWSLYCAGTGQTLQSFRGFGSETSPADDITAHIENQRMAEYARGHEDGLRETIANLPLEMLLAELRIRVQGATANASATVDAQPERAAVDARFD